MKFLSIYLGILSLACIHESCAQSRKSVDTAAAVTTTSNDRFQFERSIPGNFVSIDVDMLDNIYLVTEGYQLKKLNSHGDSLAAFNDVKKYGNPSYIDVSNPLKILVYYQNFSTVVILDRLLVVRNTINFRKQNIFSVKAIATSYDNNIWLFDEQDFKLKKIDEEGKLLLESTDMRLLVDSVPSPVKITDSENQVYLYDARKGFFVFDYYGALKNNLPFINWENTAIGRKRIYGFSNGQLHSYDLNVPGVKDHPLPVFFKDYQSIRAMNGKVYLLKKNGIEIYTVQ